jgi:hypothetical protein
MRRIKIYSNLLTKIRQMLNRSADPMPYGAEGVSNIDSSIEHYNHQIADDGNERLERDQAQGLILYERQRKRFLC